MQYKNSSLWNEGWLFALTDENEEQLSKPDYPDENWQEVTLPHDWDCAFAPQKEAKSGAGGGYAKAGIGWYRKHFSVGKGDLKKQISLIFEGIFMDCTIYLNGRRIGSHIYGYSTFSQDLTDALKEGKNLLAIRVDNSRQPVSRWYTGSGIYRDVYIRKNEDLRLTLFGGRVDTGNVVSEEAASLFFRCKAENLGRKAKDVQIFWKLKDKRGKEVASVSAGLKIGADTVAEASTGITLSDAHLWSPTDPYLYTLITTLTCEGKVCDERKEKIGIREGNWSASEGFSLNGAPLKIKGVCLHHDSGLFGAAFYKEVWQEKLYLLKDMGVNGIRCAHNPPAPGLLELCDELGFVVMDEIFDEWMLGKNKNENYFSDQLSFGIAEHFTQIAKTEMENMIFRDYNHPSVILWSIGNEIPEQSSPVGAPIAEAFVKIVHDLDPHRPATSACDNIESPPAYRTTEAFLDALDVVGYNYVGRWTERAEYFYEQDKLKRPDRIVIGSENPSVGGDRADYSMSDPLNRNYTTAALTHEALWRFTASRPYVAGDFIWTGIDYLGEAMWPRRGAACGPIDSAGFLKDAFYYFRSIWNTQETTLHVLPHWSFDKKETGKFKSVIVYTNCERVRLSLNGKVIGEKGSASCPRFGATKSWNDEYFRYHPTTGDLHLSFDVPFEEGTLLAEGFVGNKKVKTVCLETCGKPVALKADVRKTGRFYSVVVSAVDEKGRLVPNADAVVTQEAEKDVTLVGMDAGDMKDLTAYPSPIRKMVGGKILAIYRVRAVGSRKKVTFKAPGLKKVTVML